VGAWVGVAAAVGVGTCVAVGVGVGASVGTAVAVGVGVGASVAPAGAVDAGAVPVAPGLDVAALDVQPAMAMARRAATIRRGLPQPNVRGNPEG
jgi:hypothetical protein